MAFFDGWNPAQYNRFAVEREKPFWDLRNLIQNVSSPAVVDLGCGDGRLSAILAGDLESGSMLGLDSSPAMIAAALERTTERITFRLAEIGMFEEIGAFDIVFANASMQWVPDHPAVLARWATSLRRGGQLAIQIPANADHPTHLVASELATEFLENPPPDAVDQNVLLPEKYAQILDDLGFEEQQVRLQVYAHHLSSTHELVEWVKGTTLTRLKGPLGGVRWEQFVDRYRERLLDEIGETSPYFYPFKRILLWGRRGASDCSGPPVASSHSLNRPEDGAVSRAR